MIGETAAWCLALSERSEVLPMQIPQLRRQFSAFCAVLFGKISTWILCFKAPQMVIVSPLLKEYTLEKVFSFDEIHGAHGD